MTTAPAIETQGVTRRYGEIQALAGVDLKVQVGEVFAVLGPNGAGKTTLVEVMEGLRRQDDGMVSILGVDPSEANRDWRSSIGAVLQSSTQNDELTVAEMTKAFAAYYPKSLDVDRLLEALDLTAQANQRTHQLSGGQRRRLDLALGLVGNPELLFLDEPTTGLDPEVRIRIWDLIQEFADDGMTILLTTHYMEEAERLADRVAVLVAGEIVAEGPPGELAGSQKTQVSFRLSGDLATAPFPEKLGELAIRNGDRFEVTTDESTATVTALLAWAGDHDGELEDLTVEKRGLEKAYLDLLNNDTEEEPKK